MAGEASMKGDRTTGREGTVIPLPPVQPGSPLTVLGAIGARRSTRAWAARPLEDEELAALCWAAQGVTSPEGLRAAPSAGALYPVSVSVADARGVWRYLPTRHALERVLGRDRREWLARAALGQEWVGRAPGVLVVAAAPAVLAPHYGARAERYAVLEAGHVAENVLLAAVALGLAAVPVAAFSDAAVVEAASLAMGQVPMVLVPVGAPP
jgi:SagB-type dehydrogenase family enzyme